MICIILQKVEFGVQLSEETAVGHYIEECVKILNLIQDEINNEKIIL